MNNNIAHIADSRTVNKYFCNGELAQLFNAVLRYFNLHAVIRNINIFWVDAHTLSKHCMLSQMLLLTVNRYKKLRLYNAHHEL